jgi:hypothetical protein
VLSKGSFQVNGVVLSEFNGKFEGKEDNWSGKGRIEGIRPILP